MPQHTQNHGASSGALADIESTVIV